MKLFKVGDTARAICHFCHSIRPTTFKERTIPFESGRGSVKDLLVSVCDTCDKVVAIPQQSVPRIKDVLKKARKPVEARVPRQLTDALLLSCESLGFDATEAVETVLFRYFVDRVHSANRLKNGLSKLAASEDAQGKASSRLSIRLNESLYEKFEELKKQTQLNSSELCRGILVQIKNDILDRKDSGLRQEIRRMLLLAG